MTWREIVHLFEEKIPILWFACFLHFLLLAALPLIWSCVHCNKFKTRCFHLSWTNVVLKSLTYGNFRWSQWTLVCTWTSGSITTSICWLIFFSVAQNCTQELLQFYCNTLCIPSSPEHFDPFLFLSRSDKLFKGDCL